jgi:uncharacterized protein YjbI with pentapeptide repeats
MERRGLRLWPVGLVLVLTFTSVVLVAAAVFYTGWELLGARGLEPERRIDSQTLFDLVKLSFGVVAGAGALVALVVAYRRQRVNEDGALREATRLHNERFTTAVAQLGEESAAVRLGGVHALAGLADDAPTQDLRQTCIDVLCAYLRLPYTAESDLPPDDAETRHAHLALREVRHTVIRLIGNHLRLPAEHPHSWQGHDFDFTAVTFDGGDLSEAVFSGGTVDFSDAAFPGGRVSFHSAAFCGATVYFNDAAFSGGDVGFGRAVFSAGTVSFNTAVFSSGTVTFNYARFTGSEVNFSNATFSGSTVTFNSPVRRMRPGVFSGGELYFMQAVFSSGAIDFNGAEFSGIEIDFGGAEFRGGTVDFIQAVFSGGTTGFDQANFSGGEVDFTSAAFTGGAVTFSSAAGVPPTGLVPQAGAPLPHGLHLAPAWYPIRS